LGGISNPLVMSHVSSASPIEARTMTTSYGPTVSCTCTVTGGGGGGGATMPPLPPPLPLWAPPLPLVAAPVDCQPPPPPEKLGLLDEQWSAGGTRDPNQE